MWVDQKNAEHAKYWMRTEEYYQIIDIMVNTKVWEGLSGEEQGILQQAMDNAGAAFRKYSQDNFELKTRIAREQYGGNIIEPTLGPVARGGQGDHRPARSRRLHPRGVRGPDPRVGRVR